MLRRRLHDAGVTMHRGVTLTALEAGGVRGRDEFDDPFERSADGVVLVTQRRSNDDIYHALQGQPESLRSEGIEAVYRVGDCVTPRLIADVVFDGHRLAREIDSDDPTIPLAYRRERMTVAVPAQA
jgi:dimethylamine/trimethylamine dehydrogenase